MTQLTELKPTATAPTETTLAETAPSELTVRYELNKDDLVAAWIYIQTKSATVRKQQRLILFYTVFITLGLLGIYALTYQPGGFPILPVFVGVFWFFFILRFRKNRRDQLKTHVDTSGFEEVLSPTVMTLSTEGMTLEDSYHHTRSKWLAITHVQQNKDYLFFFITPLSAHAVPKRAFDSPQDADAFYQFARQYCPQQSHCPQCQYSLRGNPGPQCPECGASI